MAAVLYKRRAARLLVPQWTSGQEFYGAVRDRMDTREHGGLLSRGTPRRPFSLISDPDSSVGLAFRLEHCLSSIA
jgi:hypothetical protein